MATLTGNLTRTDFVGGPGTPRTNQIITARCHTGFTAIIITCTGCGGSVSPGSMDNYSYVTTTTDCSGNFSLTLATGTRFVDVNPRDLLDIPSANPCSCSYVPPTTINNPADPEQSSGGAAAPIIWTGTTDPTHWNSTGNGEITYNPGTGVLTGTININCSLGANGGSIGDIQVVVKNGTSYYSVDNASITMTDTCGNTNTFITTPGTSGLLNWGGPGWSDWPFWNSMTINSGIPTDCSYGTNPNLTFIGTIGGGGIAPFDYQTSVNTLPVTGGVGPSGRYFNFRWLIILQDCTGVTNGNFMADGIEGVLTIAWCNSSSALKLARHLNPSANIGSGSTGWETTQVFTGETAENVSCVYLQDKKLYLTWLQPSAPTFIKSKLNSAFGITGAWSTTSSSTGPATPESPMSVGRAPHITYRFTAKVAGGIKMDKDVTSIPTFLGGGTPSGVSNNTYVGGAWVEDKYICVYNGTTNIQLVSSTDGITWGTATTLSGLTDKLVFLVNSLDSKVLVGLTYNSGTQKCRTIRSYDKGITWEQDTVDIGVIPSLSIPPVLVPMQEGVYACWIVSDTPNFVFTDDHGKTWS